MRFWLWPSKWSPWNTAEMVLTSCERIQEGHLGCVQTTKIQWLRAGGTARTETLKLPRIGWRTLSYRKFNYWLKHWLHKERGDLNYVFEANLEIEWTWCVISSSEMDTMMDLVKTKMTSAFPFYQKASPLYICTYVFIMQIQMKNF